MFSKCSEMKQRSYHGSGVEVMSHENVECGILDCFYYYFFLVIYELEGKLYFITMQNYGNVL